MQTSYSQDPAHGLPGQVANGRPSDMSTHIADGAVTAGLYVVPGTNAADAAVPATGFTAGLGVVAYNPLAESQSIADNGDCAVVRKGVVWVAFEADTAPTPNTAAYARHTANGAGKLTLGAIRADADASNASAIPGGTFRRVFASEGIAELELA